MTTTSVPAAPPPRKGTPPVRSSGDQRCMALPWELVEAVGLRTFTSDREPLVTTAERR